MPSYTAWWLRSHGVVTGRLPDADPLLAALYDLVDASRLDPEFLAAAGALREIDDADPDDVLARLADPAREMERAQVKALYAWADPVRPPSRVRAVRGGELVVVGAGEAVVVDAPDLLPLVGARAVVPVALADSERVADSLDLPLASELAEFKVVSCGTRDGDHVVHDRLEVTDADGRRTPVAWRMTDGELHVDAGRLAFGLGRGRAWRSGVWARRHLLTEQARGVTPQSDLATECDLD